MHLIAAILLALLALSFVVMLRIHKDGMRYYNALVAVRDHWVAPCEEHVRIIIKALETDPREASAQLWDLKCKADAIKAKAKEDEAKALRIMEIPEAEVLRIKALCDEFQAIEHAGDTVALHNLWSAIFAIFPECGEGKWDIGFKGLKVLIREVA